MRLFIYELISAGGLGDDVTPSLRREGAAMLTAVVEDFARIAGVEVVTLLADDCPASFDPHVARVSCGDEATCFRDIAARSDAALVIAPEFDDLLATRSQWALDASCALLGSTPRGIRLAGDKFRLGQWLEECGVPTPKTWLAQECPREKLTFPCICKPRDGAGSQGVPLVQSREELPLCMDVARAERSGAELVVQPFHPGLAVSVACLRGPRASIWTPGATQRLSEDGRFQYLGGRTPLPPSLRERAVRLARRAVEAVPGLLGFVGVDLVLGDAPHGADDVVIEINPRLTTSYIGLRQLARANLADLWLRLWNGTTIEVPEWEETVIDFSADGHISPHPAPPR